jgi:poly-gamma-glutamate biosynthesis protein PgsC/CapC
MLIAEAIGLGLVASLFFVEAVGFAAGGFVVPGYIALFLDSPLRLLGTVLAATATYLCMRAAGRFLLIYGRRSLVLAVLLGFVFGSLTTRMPRIGALDEQGALTAIGFIIPGLLAYWMTRQGIVRTLSSMLVAATLVRFALIIIHGGALLETPLL